MADTLSSGGSGATRVRSNRIVRTILKVKPEVQMNLGSFVFYSSSSSGSAIPCAELMKDHML